MYYKQISDGYIVAIGTTEATNVALTEITEEEYQRINSILAACPTAPTGYGCKLKTDLSWEQYALPPMPQTYTPAALAAMTNAELEAVLYSYGISTSLNKQNLMRLILAAQEEGDAL